MRRTAFLKLWQGGSPVKRVEGERERERERGREAIF
jgi:hypothetical protein